MNMNDDPTVDQLRAMLVVCDDENYRHCLWVDDVGDVHLDQIDDGGWFAFRDAISGVSVGRLESFDPGNGYTGPGVPDETVAELFRGLKHIWKASDFGRVRVGVVDWIPPEGC